MKTIDKTTFPIDHYYYRTSSPDYRRYVNSPKIMTFDIWEWKQFAWKKKIFWDWFVIIKYERTDVEPDVSWLKEKFWLKHAWIIWIPERITDKPKWWKRFYMQTHFVNANVTILEQNYYKKWSERAQRARKKFLNSWCIIQQVEPHKFIEAFQKTPVSHIFKRDYIEYYKKMTDIEPKNIRSYIAVSKDNILWWLAVHDYHSSSVHMVAFTNKKYYKLQPGTWLIDTWFSDSLKNWIKYIDFDRTIEPLWPRDQKWYSDFKKNFIECMTSFTNSYFKIF